MKKVVAVAIGLGVLAGLGLGATIAFAQGPTPTPPVPAPFGWRMHGPSMTGGWGFGAEWETKMHEAVAKALGLTLDQLNAELRAGKTIAQIAQEKKLDLSKVRDEVFAAHKAQIQQAVKDGKLTQAQADWMLQRMEAMKQYFGQSGGCPMWSGNFGRPSGMMGGFRRGGMMGGRWGFPGTPPATK